MSESKVALQPESTGPAVRTLQVTRLLSDGTLLTEQQQVVNIADENGSLLNLNFDEQLEVLKDIRELMRMLVSDVMNMDVDESGFRG